MTTSSADHNTIEEDASVLVLATLRATLEHLGKQPIDYGSVGHLMAVEFRRDDKTNRPTVDQLILKFSEAEVLIDFCDIRRLPDQGGKF